MILSVAGFGVRGLNFIQDTRVTMTLLADRWGVELPVTVEWDVTDFSVTGSTVDATQEDKKSHSEGQKCDVDGARILPNTEAGFEASELGQINEPQSSGVALLRPHHTLFTELHRAANLELGSWSRK